MEIPVYPVALLTHLIHMEALRRREFIAGLLLLTPAGTVAAGNDAVALRGKLVKGPEDKPAIQSADGKLVFVTGDEDTTGVLKDARLAGSVFEVLGKRISPDHFEVNPIHTRALYAYRGGKRLMVTYWCDVCAIRTYTPGLCWCCREETALDLRDPESVK